ncbi:Oidioi.mRNA.OKI2018_I69.PAR.g10263.t1.cds [Oikopleura dioica]|uniref:Oidioi.mRNA.OKI2018_I69.PAR.g10263.t1.cds n=1 Tax=Oikopleura dioica TaxID=34765 RepID=A0ABN7RV38_OIKDI|nr:Oidioi.mRNA.OKI2018_I69.PAR.g10263.t1.cds [Oikopleura dioica]
MHFSKPFSAEICEESPLQRISQAWNEKIYEFFRSNLLLVKIQKIKKEKRQNKSDEKVQGRDRDFCGFESCKRNDFHGEERLEELQKVLKCRKQKNCLKTPEKLFKLKKPKKSKKSPHLITEIQISTTKSFIPGFHQITWDVQEWNGTKIDVDSDSRFKTKNCDKGKKWTLKILEPEHRGIYYAHVGATNDYERVAITKQKKADYIHSDFLDVCKSSEKNFCSMETSLEMNGCNGGYCCVHEIYTEPECVCKSGLVGKTCRELARSTENLPTNGGLQLKEWMSTLFLLLFVAGFAFGSVLLWKRKKNDRLQIERNLEKRRNTEQLENSMTFLASTLDASQQHLQIPNSVSKVSLVSNRSEKSLLSPPCGHIFNQSQFQ